MRKIILSAAIAASALFAMPLDLQAAIHIIPYPQEVSEGQGAFTLTPSTVICAKGKEAQAVAAFFAAKIKASTGYSIAIVQKPQAGCINLAFSKDIKEVEGYTLKVTQEGVTATAQTAQGLFYAMQSLMQLFPPQIESATPRTGIAWTAQAVSIKDAPRFKYRGVMMDVCRHFVPVEVVKRQLDVLALFKINNFHWHLTEDQGWRVEIKKYPKLTQSGAFRTEGDGSRYGGYYTQEQIKDVVAYAKARFINVVPELEIPGHELAAISSYNWLSCRGDSITPRIIWGVEDVVMCPGKETTFRFLEDVIDELVKLFPSKYFHIGGDESPRGEWKECPLCQARIKSLGLKDEPNRSKEAQLQSYVVGRIEKYLNKKGKSIIGWDEILEGGNLNKTATVMSWRGEDGGIAAAKAGHDVIMTPGSQGMYIDHYQGDPMIEPMAIGGYAPLAKTYAYDPVPKELVTEGKAGFVKGVQVNLWAEYLLDSKQYEYQLYPRALALSEIAWTNVANKSAKRFLSEVDGDAYLRLQEHGVNFHVPLVEQPDGSFNHVVFIDSTALEFTTTRPETIVYTTNGAQPTAQSAKYTAPISITQTTTVKAATLLPCGIVGPARTITVEKQAEAEGQPLTENAKHGLTMRVARGTFFKTAELLGVNTVWEAPKVIEKISQLRTQTSVPGNVRNVKNYSAIAEGKIAIPQDGVYEFLSNNAEVWIDGVKVVDNDNALVKRSLRNGGMRALCAGLHSIRVVFLGHIGAGWPTYWDDAKVQYRLGSKGDFKVVGPDMLYQ